MWIYPDPNVPINKPFVARGKFMGYFISKNPKVEHNFHTMGPTLPYHPCKVYGIFTYQHLQRGAKWFLKGVNSPSLRV